MADKLSRRNILIAGASLPLALSLPARASVPGLGATELTQLLNLAQLADQSVRQINQVRNQISQITNQIEQIQIAGQSLITEVQNTIGLPEQIWTDFQEQARNLRDAIENGGRLIFTSQNIDDHLREVFGGYEEYRTNPLSRDQYAEKYAEINKEVRKSIESAAKAVATDASTFDTDRQMLEMFKTANTRTARTSLLQTSNQIATEQLGFFQNFKRVLLSQYQAMISYFASSTDVEAARKAQELEYYKPSAVTRDNNTDY